MQLIALFLLAGFLGIVSCTAQNACSNGSFEELGRDGFPSDWAPLGHVEVSTNAFSGRRALRLVRAGEPVGHETGLNRARLIQELRGGMAFAYRGVAASNAFLRIYVIPVNADGIEKANAARAVFTVPPEQIGDGQWHRGRIKYDYSGNLLVKAVHYAARIEGAAGELWLDDVAHLQRVGPLLRLALPRLVEDPWAPGRRATMHVPVDNDGDAAANRLQARLELPPGLRAAPLEVSLEDLRVGGRALPAWTIEGERTRADVLRFLVACATETNETRLNLAPGLDLKSCGPASPVALRGEQVTIECLVVNTGQVAVLEPVAQFSCGTESARDRTAQIWPGQSALLRATFIARAETVSLDAAVRLAAWNCAGLDTTNRAALTVGVATLLPEPSGKIRSVSGPELALLENEHVRLAFRRNSFGWGLGELQVRRGQAWHRVAWLPGLARVEAGPGDQPAFSPAAPQAQSGPGDRASLRFAWTQPGTDASVAVSFELSAGEKVIRTRHEFIPRSAGQLGYFEGPSLYVLERDEAVFPGVEWLVGEEVSSGTLDIAAAHSDRIRHRVHPNWITVPAMGVCSGHGAVGLLWDPHQKWDGTRDRPGARFSSPDRVDNQRAHRLGLFVPAAPEFVKPNTWGLEIAQRYPLQPDRPLRIEAMIFADGDAHDALAAMDEWVRQFGLAQPGPPPRGSYEREIEFSMRGYLESLWVPGESSWWTTKGGGAMSGEGRPPEFIADLLAGELLSPDAEVRRRCRARASEVLAVAGGEARLDAQRFPNGFAPLTDSASAAALLGQRDKDGAWKFNADQVGTGPFVGLDYHELGPDDAVELGTCARKAFEVLRYARISGDGQAYEQMLPTLQLMESFRVPRAAQVWEVPVHTPDILAAADAVDAFLEAYRFRGEARWLNDAVAWARRGLPFVYLWQDAERPYLLGASIPVFGATWMQGSWFGRPVQWNGLRYAEALLKLGDLDQSMPWRQVAVLVIHSALRQQDTTGENVALWPDNIGAIQSDKCPWVFAPRMILQNVLKLLGRDENPATVILGQGEQRLHLTSTARLEGAAWDGKTCAFQATFPPGEQGLVTIFNLARPSALVVQGQSLPEVEHAVPNRLAVWSYDEVTASLTVRLTNAGPSSVRIEGATWLQPERLPQLAERIRFEFDRVLEGWTPLHQVTGLRVRDGVLQGRITGGDPYLARPSLRVRGADAPVIRIRLRLTAGHTGQFYWATQAAPGFSEERVITFPIQADGAFHEYTLKTGDHPGWRGQIITAIRLDPGNGAREAEFALDYVRGERLAP